VYTHQAVTEGGMIYASSFIVIKNGYGVAVKFTRLQHYAGIYDSRTYLTLTIIPEAKLYYIRSMLNYAFAENGERFQIKHAFVVTKDFLQQFFTNYAPGKKTVETKI